MSRSNESFERELHLAAGQKIKWLRKRDGLSQKELETRMRRRGVKIGSQKSFSNLEKGRFDSRLGIYRAIATEFGVPPWVMFIPCEPAELLEGDKLRRVVKLMEDYLACDDEQRKHVENATATFAAVRRAKS